MQSCESVCSKAEECRWVRANKMLRIVWVHVATAKRVPWVTRWSDDRLVGRVLINVTFSSFGWNKQRQLTVASKTSELPGRCVCRVLQKEPTQLYCLGVDGATIVLFLFAHYLIMTFSVSEIYRACKSCPQEHPAGAEWAGDSQPGLVEGDGNGVQVGNNWRRKHFLLARSVLGQSCVITKYKVHRLSLLLSFFFSVSRTSEVKDRECKVLLGRRPVSSN